MVFHAPRFFFSDCIRFLPNHVIKFSYRGCVVLFFVVHILFSFRFYLFRVLTTARILILYIRTYLYSIRIKKKISFTCKIPSFYLQ